MEEPFDKNGCAFLLFLGFIIFACMIQSLNAVLMPLTRFVAPGRARVA
jgi:hypothetical protein